jgi:hypothetical protein
VPIYEVSEHEGQQYYSMQYVEGTSLAKHPNKWRVNILGAYDKLSRAVRRTRRSCGTLPHSTARRRDRRRRGRGNRVILDRRATCSWRLPHDNYFPLCGGGQRLKPVMVVLMRYRLLPAQM